MNRTALLITALAVSSCTGNLAFAQTADPTITYTIRDFGPRSFDYAYGPAWKINQNIKPEGDGVLLDTNEAGGAGIVLNGKNLSPFGQTHLAVRAKVLDGNAAGKLQINLNGPGANKSVQLDLSKLTTTYSTVLITLPDGRFDKVDQIQFQGTNWGGGNPLKLVIDKVGTSTPDEAANAEAIAKAKEAAKNDPTAAPPAKDKPNVPGWGFYPQYPDAWMNFHKMYLDRTKKGQEKQDINIVFLGDSITQGWDKDIWEAKYKPLGAVNYGIGGDSTRQILWRIQNGEFDGINPKLVVLMIGTNNLYGDFNSGSEEEIAKGVEATVGKIKEKLPNTKILLLAILPRENAWFSGRIAKINAQISKLADGKTVRYLDMGAQFAGTPEKGDVYPELFKGDKLHPVKKGYEVMDAAIYPVIQEMLN